MSKRALTAIPNGDEAPDLEALFHEVFPRGRGEIVWSRAPGRVNLIGEHTDYNDGFVLPVAVNREVQVLARRRPDDRVVVYSANFSRRASFELDALGLATRQTWINYPQGVADAMQRAGHRLPGMNIVLWGNIPLGAGMSSSAAVEVACMLAFRYLAGLEPDARDDVLLAQKAENNFVGVQSGVMDQFASRLGRQGCALLLDCRSLEYEPIPIALPGVELCVIHSGVPRGLASTAYNTRREECEEGVRLLREHYPTIKALRDVSLAEFAMVETHLPDVIRRRCRHVISENARVGQTAEALRQGDLAALGMLFAQSHASMRDDYEMSHRAVDLLVELAMANGAEAARLTGGGWGGCTVNLVRSDHVEAFEAAVAAQYAASGFTPTFYHCQAMDGAQMSVLPS